eukprot:Blabericola_migrator_1__2358@NODE_165_length_12243_cov_242_656784_g143_i0_p7_GENE_NODE_165_length_12243_cov_242_656784_g143_i0NODE_165_length_12243_cov_242_656784_g143_i0_p7_ORF_typecomplete_len156_score4_76Myb_CC_LHEQLE/PF14379_6/0_11_NODE_165_length_12243_cov_242_656784_g143_i06271094
MPLVASRSFVIRRTLLRPHGFKKDGRITWIGWRSVIMKGTLFTEQQSLSNPLISIVGWGGSHSSKLLSPYISPSIFCDRSNSCVAALWETIFFNRIVSDPSPVSMKQCCHYSSLSVQRQLRLKILEVQLKSHQTTIETQGRETKTVITLIIKQEH